MVTHPLRRKPLIIVPTYNEAENIEELTKRIWEHVPDIHLLFVDDSSQDGTRELIQECRERSPEKAHLIERPRRLGLGTAYITGFKWALERDNDAVIEMDADLSHDPADLPRILDLLETHDVVIGSRYVPGGGTRDWSFLRQLISRLGSLYARGILRLRVRDLTGGFNAWRRRVLESVPLDEIRSEGYSFQIELKFRAHLAGFSLYETPILFVERRAGRSKMSWRVVWEAMFRVWSLATNRRFTDGRRQTR